jgi:hypothetical protein
MNDIESIIQDLAQFEADMQAFAARAEVRLRVLRTRLQFVEYQQEQRILASG